jgi:hypothetical protein
VGGGDIWAIAQGALDQGRLPVDDNGVYFVLTSADVDMHDGFCSSFCGWHTYAGYQGHSIKYAFVGDSTRCNGSCGTTGVTPNGDAAADDMASIVYHELSETVTDPLLNAWGDSAGENADKCAWQFGAQYQAGHGGNANVRLGSRDFLLQENWVNAGGGSCTLSYDGGGGGGSGISPSAWYRVVNANSGKCIDETGWSTDNGTPLEQWDCLGTQENQQWQFAPTDSGYYNVHPRNGSWLGWDVTGGPGATDAGVQVQLWGVGGSGGANQQWMPVDLGGGRYQFVARHSGRCLDVPWSGTDSGIVLQQWDCNGTGAQSFLLQQVN